MKKLFVQALKEDVVDFKKDKEEHGGLLGYDSVRKCYTNSRNHPDIMRKFYCYESHRSARDFKQLAKDAVNLSGLALSNYKYTTHSMKYFLQHGASREQWREARETYKKLDLNIVSQKHAKLGMLENNIAGQGGIMRLELQTVMAGVTRRFGRSEGKAMYQSIFHYGQLDVEEDFDYVRSQNDFVIALSYRHQGTNRMSEPMFLYVLDNIFHAVHVMKPQVTHIRLWVDAAATRRAQGRRWVSKGILPYTVFPVCVCDQHFSLRWNRTWINIETILGLMGAGLMVFDQQMVRDMGLAHHINEAEQARGFYFRGAQCHSIDNLTLLASIALRGALDGCHITWKADYDDILQLLSRAAICDSMGIAPLLLSQDAYVERPVDINFQARRLITTMLGYENPSRCNIPFMEVRPLNTHIEYVWGHNTPYPCNWDRHKLLLSMKHLGCINRAVIECAENLVQKDEAIWLVMDFVTYQVAVEFHTGWSGRKDVRLVHVLIIGNRGVFEGQIMKTLITCWSGDSDVNYKYSIIHKMEYIANAINVVKVITELQRIGAVAEQSVMQKFWLVKNRDVCWTMGATW